MNKFNEDNLVEQTVISLIKELWQDEGCHINAFSELEDQKLGRAGRDGVLLIPTLRKSLIHLNPNVPIESIEEAMLELSRDRSTLPLVRANQEIYKLLKDGLNVDIISGEDKQETVTVKYIDFENVDNNHYQIVSQLWILGETYTKRPDVILFVNGIPILLF